MKKHLLPIIAVASISFSLFFLQCSQPSQPENTFSFVFLADIHVQPEKNATEGFMQAIDTINKLKPDFVITGGDLIMDALWQTYGRADSLYTLYTETVKSFDMPVYNTMGNHEIFGIYPSSGVEKSHPEYGEKMYENRIGKRYYSFNYNGWYFLILDSVEDTEKGSYIGKIDEKQIEWIKEELANIDSVSPIVLSTHIPFITIFKQIYYGTTLPNDSSLVIVNGKEVLDLFEGHNLKLVLQGHLHTIEDIYVDGTHFITAGAISARWWTGPNRGFEEGFVLVKVKDNDFEWEYVDYEWEVEEKEKI